MTDTLIRLTTDGDLYDFLDYLPPTARKEHVKRNTGRYLAAAIVIVLVGGVTAAVARRSNSTRSIQSASPLRTAVPATAPSTAPATTLPTTTASTKGTVDALLAKVVASTGVWNGARYKSPLDKAGVAKVVLDNLQATYEAIGRIPSEVPSSASSAARLEGIHLWTRIWSEFECARVESGYTTDRTGCNSKDLFPDPFTITLKIVDLLAPYSDMSSATWVARING